MFRPKLVLKCEQGYVGYKSTSCPRLECNKTSYETIGVERDQKGLVHFKGKYPIYVCMCAYLKYVESAEHDGYMYIQARPLGRGPLRAPIQGDGLVYLFKICGDSAEHEGTCTYKPVP